MQSKGSLHQQSDRLGQNNAKFIPVTGGSKSGLKKQVSKTINIQNNSGSNSSTVLASGGSNNGVAQ
jgi:hypothetical protein